MRNAAEKASALRPWLLSLGSLALLFAGLLIGINLLPDPWPRIIAAVLCAGLLILLGFMAAGSYMRLPFGFATWDTVGAVRDVRVRTLTAAELKPAGK